MIRIQWLFVASLLTGCVSHGNLFQDGKTLGKNKGDATFAISMNATPGFESDSTNDRISIKPYHFLAPWAQVQVQYGLLDRLDVGGSFGLGLFSIGAEGFAKYAFTPQSSKLGAAIFASAGIGGSNDKASPEGSSGFSQGLVALPISIDISDKSAIVIQPIYERQRYRFRVDEPYNYRRVFSANVYKIGLGFVHVHGSDLKVHYNVALNYWEAGQKYWPSFGVAFSKP